MEKYCRVISISGRTFHCSQTMGDIFLAHAGDLASRGVTELVSLVHEGGVDKLLVGPATRITVNETVTIAGIQVVNAA